MKTPAHNHRILLIDDNPAIHQDVKKILQGSSTADASFTEAKALLFDEAAESLVKLDFEIDSAFQGQEGLAMLRRAIQEGRPYAVAFVDVRMPPGWDGVETISHLWQHAPDLQILICTAYSDYSWEAIIKKLGHSDSLLILKKPFDNVEVLQLAHALTKKWSLTQQANNRMADLDRAVMERTHELRISEERFSKAFQSNPLPMAIQTLGDQKFVDVNDSFLKLFGHTREEVLERTPMELSMWANPAAYTKLMESVVEDQSVRELKSSLRIKSGQVRESLVFVELFNLKTEPCLLTLIQDISERLTLENQLRQAQKMEAIGQLAAGVAHDFNNILTIVQGHLSLLIAAKKLQQKEEFSLNQALSASERAAKLTRQLLAFSRKQVMETRPVQLGKLFDQTSGMLQRLIGEQVQLEFQCPRDLPSVYADHCNIEQVILNLAVNARDAMPQGGHINIAAECVTIDQEHCKTVSEASEGQFVCLSVADTGSGMDETTKSHIFEPFFTTKEVGKGTGMGLATVYGIVKQHSGWIEVDSQLGAGTVFRIYLPVSTETSDTTFLKKPQAPAASPQGNETILVTEDEPFLREFVQTVLENNGYKVLLAGDGPEALEIWKTQSDQISLLLTDMVMPGGMTGKELAEKLTSQKPGLRVIFTSGYSLTVLGEKPKLEVGYSLLQKPYRAEVLTSIVRQCLDVNSSCNGVVNNSWTAAGSV